MFIPASGQTGWAMVGQVLGGWKLKEYRSVDEVLVLAKGEREERLRLSENVVGTYNPGILADTKALIKAMNFEQRIRRLDWRKNLAKQMLTNAGLPKPSTEQMAEFEKEIERLFDFEKIQTHMAVAMSEVYTQEELRAQTAFYATEAGQAVLDKQMRGLRALDEKEPEFYATPVGRSVKAKEKQVEAQMEKTVAPYMDETMKAISMAAFEYVEAQTAPATGAKP